MRFAKPEVGQWYLNRSADRMFEVVSMDEASGAVEIQDYDGTLDEIADEEWLALDVEPVEPPEDLTCVFDDVEVDSNADPDEKNFHKVTPELRAEWQSEAAPQDW